MKLLWCRFCDDVVKLPFSPTGKKRFCACKAAWGRYLANDKLKAEIGGSAVAIGFENLSFRSALEKQPTRAKRGKRFEAFVIPKECPTIQRVP